MSPAPPLACTMLLPGATATTRPVLSTVATSGLSDFHTTRASGSGVPSSRSACGVIRTLSPGKQDRGGRVQRQRRRRPPTALPPVTSTASDARLPCSRASTLASPGATPSTRAALRHAGDRRVRAPEDELGGRDDVALAVVRRGEDGLLLADAEGHRLGRDLDFDGALSGERGRDGWRREPRHDREAAGGPRRTPACGAVRFRSERDHRRLCPQR